MDTDDNARMLYGLIVVGLLVASLAARRLPMKQYLKMFLAWVAIFAAIFVVMSFRPEMKMIWERVTGELTGAPRQSVEGSEIRLTRQDDGHFWLRAKLNGYDADMMVDSGASFSAINGETARAAKLTLDPESEAVELNTANGVVKARTATVKSLIVGDVELQDHDVVVSDGFGDTNVVGMNFLDGFESWNVTGDVMTLRI
jgi:aspartyl protease family protein